MNLPVSPNLQRGVAAVLLLTAVITVYAPSLAGAFVYDDEPAIVKNHHIRHLWPLREALSLDQWNASHSPLSSCCASTNKS